MLCTLLPCLLVKLGDGVHSPEIQYYEKTVLGTVFYSYSFSVSVLYWVIVLFFNSSRIWECVVVARIGAAL